LQCLFVEERLAAGPGLIHDVSLSISQSQLAALRTHGGSLIAKSCELDCNRVEHVVQETSWTQANQRGMSTIWENDNLLFGKTVYSIKCSYAT
jgi:hypothetical protein